MAVAAKSKKPSAGSRKASRSGSKTREGDRSTSAAPAVTKEEEANLPAKPLPPEDKESQPGFTVTVRGSLSKVLASIVLKKGPIRASSKEAAIAQFMGDIGTQFKKPDLIAVEACHVEEVAAPIQPKLPLGNRLPPDMTEKDREFAEAARNNGGQMRN